MSNSDTPRIDLRIYKDKQVLISPAARGVEFDVIPDDGTDRSGITFSISEFQKQISAKRL